jgi:hypothetical protein
VKNKMSSFLKENRLKVFIPILLKGIIIIFSNISPASAISQQKDTTVVTDTVPFQKSGPGEKLTLRGYIKYLPFLNVSREFNEFQFNHLLHNRLNFRWYAMPELFVAVEFRNRIFSGENVRNNHRILKSILEQDDGTLDASFVPVANRNIIVHTISDRFYVDYTRGNRNIRIGRQRINWGINMVFNPNDLFNTWSFFDFDYEERPGADAVRFTQFITGMDRIEIVVNPAKDVKNSVAAGLYGFNLKGYDFQTIAGYFRNRVALGGGWAGNLRQVGFKGEFTWFRDIEPIQGIKPANLVGGISLSHLFSNNVFFTSEYLYNGGKNRFGQQIPFLLTRPLSPDNLSFAEHTVFIQLIYPVTPVFSTGISGIAYMEDKVVFISPLITYSLKTNLDAALISQIFTGPSGSPLAQAGYLIAGTLKWSF